jgi:hypothetical protein
MKKGGSSVNGSNLDNNNIIKPIFHILTEEDHKALEAYRTEVDELFYLRYEVTRQGLILKDVASIIIRKAEVTPKVRPNPLLSLNNVQSMINSVLERQAKNNDELMRRLIKEWDGKKLVNTNVIPSSSCDVNFTQINPQPSGASAGGMTMPNPSAQLLNHFHSRTTIDGLTPTFRMPQ